MRLSYYYNIFKYKHNSYVYEMCESMFRFFSMLVGCLLQYRSLLEAETLKFSIAMQYPIAWNSHQNCILSMTGTKATLHFIYEHRYFFQGNIHHDCLIILFD